MRFCKKCGAELEEDAEFCPACGTKVEKDGKTADSEQSGEKAGPEQNAQENKEKGEDFSKKANAAFEKFNDTKDETASFEKKDIDDNKVYSIFAYLGILILVPILAAKDSKFARFHTNQGLMLFIVSLIWSIVMSTVLVLFGMLLPPLAVVFGIINSLGGIVILVFTILGIVNAAKGQAKELPFIGKYRILK